MLLITLLNIFVKLFAFVKYLIVSLSNQINESLTKTPHHESNNIKKQAREIKR